MCRFTGSKHRDYSPSRSVKLTYWRRLPTIQEATDVEMAEEMEPSEIGEKQLEDNVFSPILKKDKNSKPRKQRSGRYIIPSLTKPDSSESYQQIQDGWSHFLRTPYADFLPETMSKSFIDNCYSLSTKKTQVNIASTGAQAHTPQEIAAWLAFFG